MPRIIEFDPFSGKETGRQGSSFGTMRNVDHRDMHGDGAEDALHMVEREMYDPHDFFGYDPVVENALEGI